MPIRYTITYIAILLWTLTLFTSAAIIEPGTKLPPCIFRQLTNTRCPSCGLTTSIILAMHGNITESFKAHPFGIIIMAGFAFAAAMAAYGLITRSRLEWLFNKYTTIVAITLTVIYILVWLCA